jgi:hypothetical protein
MKDDYSCPRPRGITADRGEPYAVAAGREVRISEIIFGAAAMEREKSSRGTAVTG